MCGFCEGSEPSARICVSSSIWLALTACLKGKEFKVNMQRGESIVLIWDVQAVDVVTQIVQERPAGDIGQVVTEKPDASQRVLVHFVDEFWGNIIIPIRAEVLQPVHACVAPMQTSPIPNSPG